jgi:hypothetical protein
VSSIEYKVCTKITQRAQLGKKKYGTTMDRTDLSRLDWLKHAQEEAMDLAVYLEKLIDEEQKKKPCKNCRCEGGVSKWTRTSSLEEFDSEKG